MAAPTVVSATIISNGTGLTVVWSEAATSVATPTIVIAGRLATLTSTLVGAVTVTFTYTIASTVYINETATLSGAAGIVTATVGGTPNAAFSGQAITNNSTQTIAASGTARASGLMVNRCMVLRKTTTTSSSTGATSQAWAPVYYPVKCSIQMRTSSEGFNAGQELQDSGYSGYFPRALSLRHGDRICSITGASVTGQSSLILEVVGAPTDHAGRGAYLFAPLREVPGNE